MEIAELITLCGCLVFLIVLFCLNRLKASAGSDPRFKLNVIFGRNPYEILILAAPFIVGGGILVLQKGAGLVDAYDADPVSGRGSVIQGHYKGIIEPSLFHWIRILSLITGGTLVLLYLHLRFRTKDA